MTLLITKEEDFMKLLKIEHSQGFFSTDGIDFKTVDKITKDDLLLIATSALEANVEFDEFDEEKLQNQAHQIIYKNVSAKMKSLVDRKDEFKDECERLYLEVYERYKQK